MFNYLIILGSAAVTYFIVKSIVKTKSSSGFDSFIEFIMYAFLNMIISYLCLNPIGRISLGYLKSGLCELQYGNTAIVFSLIVSVIMGIVFAIIKKEVKLDIEIEKVE